MHSDIDRNTLSSIVDLPNLSWVRIVPSANSVSYVDDENIKILNRLPGLEILFLHESEVTFSGLRPLFDRQVSVKNQTVLSPEEFFSEVASDVTVVQYHEGVLSLGPDHFSTTFGMERPSRDQVRRFFPNALITP